MKRHYFLWAALCHSLFMAGCNMEGLVYGRDAYLKAIKPYLQNWEKPGITSEGRRQDSISCGSIDPSNRQEPDSEPHFSQEKIEAARRNVDQSTTNVEVRLRSEWQKCMIKKGYRCTESWMLLP